MTKTSCEGQGIIELCYNLHMSTRVHVPPTQNDDDDENQAGQHVSVIPLLEWWSQEDP